MRMFRPLIQYLGPYGVAGLGVLALCAAVYAAMVQPAERELRAQQEAAQRLKSRVAYQPVSSDNRGDDLQRFYALFPPTGKIAPETQKLWVIANEYKIDLHQGEYRLETSGPGLARYRITLPIKASYGQIRNFIAFILREIPTASIDGLRFERKKISDTQLDAQIKLTLYLRSANLAGTAP
jgi:hypothetical protein